MRAYYAVLVKKRQFALHFEHPLDHEHDVRAAGVVLVERQANRVLNGPGQNTFAKFGDLFSVLEHNARCLQVVGDFLSYDPYGIMFRKGDAQLADLVARTFRDLAEDGEIERQYKRWIFERLDLPMSPQLETLIRTMAAKPE